MSSPALPVTPLLAGEKVLARWQPRLTLFAHRAALLSFVTALALASLGYLTLLQWLIAVPVFTVIFVVIFDDLSTWFRHRNDRWFLTDRRLIYEHLNAPEENAAVSLDQLDWLRPWAWWALRIGFTSGTSTTMQFLPRPRDIRTRILNAKAGFEDAKHD